MLAALRRIHRTHVSRLRDLSVDVRELGASEGRDALARFARMFLGAERAPTFLSITDAARATGREIDHGLWLREGAPLPALKPRFGWLADWHSGTECIRFDRRPALPALRLPVFDMLDEWAFSWPGTYVCLARGRALVVSLDLDVSCYDSAARRPLAYR